MKPRRRGYFPSYVTSHLRRAALAVQAGSDPAGHLEAAASLLQSRRGPADDLVVALGSADTVEIRRDGTWLVAGAAESRSPGSGVGPTFLAALEAFCRGEVARLLAEVEEINRGLGR